MTTLIKIQCQPSDYLINPALAAELAAKSIRSWNRHDEAVHDCVFGGDYATRTKMMKNGFLVTVWRANKKQSWRKAKEAKRLKGEK